MTTRRPVRRHRRRDVATSILEIAGLITLTVGVALTFSIGVALIVAGLAMLATGYALSAPAADRIEP